MLVLGDLRRVVARFNEDQGFLLAAALSFVLLLCLAPFALILFSIAGFLMESDEIAEHLFDAAMLLFPAYGYELAEFLTVLARERLVTGFLGVASWALFATQLFSLARTVLNRAFRVAARRGFLHGFVVDLFAVTIVGALAVAFAVAIIVAVALGDVAARLIPGAPLTAEALRRLLALPLMYAAGLGLLFFVYRALPNMPVPARAAAITTLAVAVAWELARWAFTAYVGMFGTYGKLYGSFGFSVAALVWIYYSATIFVLGAELAALLTRRSPAPSPGTAS
ncbi:MAG: YihY/virulence factor BrkB family protein [Candidatus Rokubacteria bacterium]|nr:YihY/virulence factor BrkB family protein [Candidatus Rokubacteria bacterium]